MKVELGTHIAGLRKLKGITQEQLGQSVGVSAPAVSKWETGISCPDISLLSPIARTLDVNLDQLLQFEMRLPEEELIKQFNEIIECARMQSLEKAENMLNHLLHTYPSDCGIKFHAAATLDFFRMLNSFEDTESEEKWKTQKKQFLEEICKSKDTKYYEKSVSSLVSIALNEDNLEEAQNLLNELPQESSDYEMNWIQFYLKKDNSEKALEVTQKRLYSLTRKLQMCLMLMMNEKMTPDSQKNLAICQVYRQIEEIFHIDATSEGFFVEAYKRMGNYVEAKNSTVKLIYKVVKTAESPNPLLFDPNIKIAKEQPIATKEMKQMILDGIKKEEFLKDFQNDVGLQMALDKLKESILETH